jgi:hypothetical protein
LSPSFSGKNTAILRLSPNLSGEKQARYENEQALLTGFVQLPEGCAGHLYNKAPGMKTEKRAATERTMYISAIFIISLHRSPLLKKRNQKRDAIIKIIAIVVIKMLAGN